MTIATPSVGSVGFARRRARVRRPPLGLWLTGAAIAVVMALPLVYLLARALGASETAWLLLWRPRTAEIVLNSLALALTVVVASALVALPLAWLHARTDLPGRRFWAVLTVLPLVIPSYVAGYTLLAAFGPRGLVQEMLAGPFGVTRLPDIAGFGGAALVLTACSYPYLLLTVRGALRGLDPACEEAARGLGRRPWDVFWRVILPQLRPALGAGSLLVALYTLSDFGAVSLLRFETFTSAIYLQYQGAFDRTLAAALSLLLVALTAVILVLEARTRGRARYYRAGVGAVRPARRLALGHWRWPALALSAAVVLVALLLPLGVLLFWLGRGLMMGLPLEAVGWMVVNSTLASTLAAAGAVLASLPLAVLAVRHAGPVTGLIERVCYAGYALPGIVIALALVFFGANYAPWLYQTLAMLVIAYVVRFLPQAIGTARAALLQVSPHLEEAARGLGHGPRQVVLRVTVPLVRSGLLTGGAIVFLTAMKELPATLLLSPIGFETLATSIWQATSNAMFSQAALPALVLVLVSVPPVAIMARREGGDA